MWAIIGLGNPGARYKETRHNAGFLVLDKLAKRHSISLKEKGLNQRAKGFISETEVILVKPLTYMNRSGLAIKEIFKECSVSSEDLIVIHDDIDLEIGRLKIKQSGSSGGHKGIQSIIDSISTSNFIRLKIGIGRDPTMIVSDYVLQKIRNQDIEIFTRSIDSAVVAVESIITYGIESAMNRFN